MNYGRVPFIFDSGMRVSESNYTSHILGGIHVCVNMHAFHGDQRDLLNLP